MIKKSLPFLLMAFALMVITYSCKKADDRPAPLPQNEEFYPLEVGKWVIYDVDSTVWDDTFCVERYYNYQLMHRVADTFTDKQGRLSFRVETSIRKKVEDPWKSHRVFYVTNTGTNLEMVYDQLRFIKMAFPVEERKSWEGNSYIEVDDPDFYFYKDWVYEYRNLGESFNTGYKVFDNTVTVLEVDEAEGDPELFPSAPATRTKSNEVYASGVGMIYREYIRWVYEPKGSQCRDGKGVIMRAVDHN
ncbi:MAG: hypothetical protein H6551_00575 [Chitinophagales bacterium]|nr:hypothetical protein [Chitinophagaceae bacterium]MCB9063616.1 hypothetical protein [Chitinophagales bacterium]